MSRYILHLPCAYSPESHASHTSPMSELTNCFTGLNAFHTGDTPRRCLDLSNLSCGSPAAPAEGSPQRDMASPHLGTTDSPALRNSRMKNCWSFSPRLLCSSPKLPPSDPHESNKENESQFGRSQRSQSKLGWFLPSLESQPEVDRVPCPLGSPVHSLPLVPSLSFHGDADGSMEEFEQDDKEGSFANSMSCSMAQLLSEPLMNQEVNLPLISIARQKGRRLFRCPSMPERLGSLERPAAKRTSTSPAAGSQPLKRLCTVPSISEEVLKGEDDQETVAPIQRRHPLQKTHSLCGLGQQLSDGVNAEVIGDFSKICALPTVTGRHQELKYITGKTMCALLNGRFRSLIESVVIVDCRYPYEYLGGHIKGAQNHPNTDEAVDFLLSKKLKASSPNKRLVLVLHCEFSSERAPQTCRLLRSEDRSANEYPALHYPELYVLKGGYRDFFQAHPEYCEPQSYCPMHHQDHREELLRCRTLSRTSADERRRRHLIHRLVKQ